MSEENKQSKTTGEEAVCSSAWLGDGLPTCEGWYAAHFPKQDHTAIVYVRYDWSRREHVVDVIGQPKEQSEELWRYKEWKWSEMIMVKSPNSPLVPTPARGGVDRLCSRRDASRDRLR